MPDDLTKLDAAALKNFADHDVQNFIDAITKLRQPSDSSRLSLYDVGSSPHPLVIGKMADDGDTGGKNVVTNLQSGAKAIDSVLTKHKSAFQDLQRELHHAIDTLLTSKDTNLQSIDALKFMDVIKGYVGDLGGGATSVPDPNGGGSHNPN